MHSSPWGRVLIGGPDGGQQGGLIVAIDDWLGPDNLVAEVADDIIPPAAHPAGPPGANGYPPVGNDAPLNEPHQHAVIPDFVLVGRFFNCVMRTRYGIIAPLQIEVPPGANAE